MRELDKKHLSMVNGGWSITTASILNFFKGDKKNQDGEWSPVKPHPGDPQSSETIGKWFGIATVAIASFAMFAVGMVIAGRK